jgi:hypothetical protein
VVAARHNFHWRVGGAFSYKNSSPLWEKKRMIVCHRRQSLALALCCVLLLVTAPLDSGAVIYQSASLSGSDYSGQGIPLTTEQLQSLVAPVALYPDPLLAQVVVAATFPDQIVVANSWLQQNRNLTGPALVQAVSSQWWDPGVKGLTQFPAILNNLAQNFSWTSQLGEAYHNQQSALMAAVQALRGKARTAENLKTTSQMTLSQPSGDLIMLKPGNPMVVSVPLYDSTQIYGSTIQTPDYKNADGAGTASITFASGIPIGIATSTDWGWNNWDCNWYQGVADYRNYPYFGNHAWHGGFYGGYIYYGNHPYRNDPTRPFSATRSSQSSGDTHGAAGSPTGVTEIRPPEVSSAFARESGGWANPEDPFGWGQVNPEGKMTAFSSWSPQADETFGTNGWGQRANSYRAWSLRGGSSGWGIGGRSGGLHW